MTTTSPSTVLRRRPTLVIASSATGLALVALAWILDSYHVTVAITALVAAALATSAQLLTGVAGLPTLGQAAYFGIGAYTAAICAREFSTVGPVQLVVATAVAAAVAAIIGGLIVRTRGLAFMLATLAVAELARVAAEHSTATDGGNGLATPAIRPLPGLPPLTDGRATYLCVLAVVACLVGAVVWLTRTRFGLILRGIADNEARTQANGINVHTHLWAAYVLAAGIAAAAGALHIASRRYIGPTDLGFDISAMALLAAVIGGHSILGACLAAAGIVAIRDVAGTLLPGHTPTMLGLLFLAAAFAHQRRTASRPRGQP
jgi:branched-chain amino acid transport system permease protein